MISDDKANTIADELLDQVRAQRRHVPVLMFYRSPELMALEPSLRADVVRHALRLLRSDPKVVLALLIYCGAVIAGLLAVDGGHAAALAAVAFIPILLVRNRLVRGTARRLAAELLGRT
jgi:hypothetical protein